jgi:hypothetical protein
MKLHKAICSCLGVSIVLVCAVSKAQAQSNQALPSAQGMTKPSSSLGGPITPTQPDFFEISNSPVPPSSLNQSLDGGFASEQVKGNPDRPAAPMIDDPPQISKGGIINIKTD